MRAGQGRGSILVAGSLNVLFLFSFLMDRLGGFSSFFMDRLIFYFLFLWIVLFSIFMFEICNEDAADHQLTTDSLSILNAGYEGLQHTVHANFLSR